MPHMVQRNQSIAFYKPCGVLSNFTSSEGNESLSGYIKVAGVYAAGRLDKDSEGLLILSNDGKLIHRMTDPNFHLPKTYLVQVEGNLTQDAIDSLQSGIPLGGYTTQKCEVIEIAEPILQPRAKPITPHGPTHWLRIVLREGKKRQIRHMTAAVNLPTLRLVRIAIGPVGLGNLLPGEWRELTDYEISRLRGDKK